MNDFTTPSCRSIPFSFSGKGGEYFKIWIVNILLTIVTLGIYSAWAKVRRKQYLYGNTTLDGSSFEYLADPKKILKGRIIVFSFYMLWILGTKYAPQITPFLLVAIVFFAPWAINKSLKFNAVNSSYRNVRFNYQATYGEAFVTFIVFGILTICSFGLLLPYYMYRIKKHVAEHSRYGLQFFSFSGSPKSFYKIYGIAFLGLMVLYAAIGVILSSFKNVPQESLGDYTWVIFIIVFAFYAFFIFISFYIKAVQTNYIYQQLNLRSNTFDCTLKTIPLFFIFLTNYTAIVFSAGLFAPFAKIRMTQYYADNLALVANSDLNDFVAKETEELEAMGEEVSDLFDIDLGF